MNTNTNSTLKVIRRKFRRMLFGMLFGLCGWVATNGMLVATEPIGTEATVANADNAILPQGSALERIYTRQAKLNSGLTEGPAVAADGSIYFTDMPFGSDNGMILRYDPKANQTTVFTSNSGKSNGLAFLKDGSAVSCDGADGGGRRLVKWNLQTREGTTLSDRFQGKRFNSPNDLVVDLRGRIYFTDPRYGGSEPRELEREAVYRLDTDGSVIEITHDVEKPNGIVLSPDQKTLYVGDHNNGGNRLKPTDPEPKRGAMKIYAFPLDASGLVNGPRRTLVDFGAENGCDGMTVDSVGNVYASCRSLARPGILVIDPTGQELAFVETGPKNQKGLFDDWKGIPSNVEFGIGDDANSLYITIDKSLYRLKVKTRGFHPHLESK